MNFIITWMYSSPPDENIAHHQIGNSASKQKAQNYYWRCVFLLFESSNRLNASNIRHLLFVNKNPPDEIDGIKTKDLLDQYNIELIEFETLTKSPKDYYGAWNTQFIVLDVLDWLKKNAAPNDNVFILDSDIIFNKPIDEKMLNDLRKQKALLYSMDYDPDKKINGLTRKELLQISKEMNSSFPADTFTYSGGEFICCLGSEISKISELGRQGFEICLERHKSNQPKFNEEAHLLSYVYTLIGYMTHTGNPYIKRIWTDRSLYSNIDGTEDQLTLWHFPAEKKHGFLKVFRSYRKINGVYKITTKNLKLAYRLEENIPSKIIGFMKTGARFLRSKLLHK